jgi:ketosteroid isomerase-like protein
VTNLTLCNNSAAGARRQFMASSLVAVIGTALGGSASASPGANTALPYPQIADTSAATPELVAFMQAFFRAKTNRDVDQTMSFFAPDLVTYIDSTLGWDLSGFDTLKAVFAKYMPNWPVTAASYPTRIMGDMQSALIAFTDTSELFGGELRILGAIDFKNGKIVRWVDYWDARAWPNLYKIEKSPPLQNFKEKAVGESAKSSMKAVVNALSKALSTGDSATATTLFSNDAIYEDLTLRTQVIGKDSIGRYLGRALKLIPFGTAMQIRHVVGSDQGGGYEWVGGTSTAVKFGVTALVLDSKGAITKMSTVYDGENVETTGIKALAMLGVES